MTDEQARNLLKQLEMRRTMKVKKVRLSEDDLNAIARRVKSSRSIQWWKDDIKQLLYEVQCLKEEITALKGVEGVSDERTN